MGSVCCAFSRFATHLHLAENTVWEIAKEINYISNRLETLSITSENGFVLLPTDHACMKIRGYGLTHCFKISMKRSQNMNRHKGDGTGSYQYLT